jgi:hypothetical protein
VLAQQQLNPAEHTNLSQSCHPGHVKVKKQAATEVAKFPQVLYLERQQMHTSKKLQSKKRCDKTPSLH